MDTPTAFARPCPTKSLILCLSHLRWDLVFQRPQHLMTRAARSHEVIYFEEPVREAVRRPSLRMRTDRSGVRIATPVLPVDCADMTAALKGLVDGLVRSEPHDRLVTWFYTPMALDFAGHVAADVTVYDCMDELSAFRDPPPGLVAKEERLFRRADVVFTGGMSLYEAKRGKHRHVFAFPSSVDASHFGRARAALADPEDQRGIGHPRVGFFGVIDERMDVDLVGQVAADLPDVQFVMLGPVVKIDEGALPRPANLHWLGSKAYTQLPAYLANWDAGWMPFALNDSTRFISPTKTPEFLAAGLPLMSTPVPDVVRGYGEGRLVTIAEGRAAVTKAVRGLLAKPAAGWLAGVDRHLATTSWDATWEEMEAELDRAGARRRGPVSRAVKTLTPTSGLEASDA